MTMNLSDAITNALEVSARLQASLDQDEWELSLEILELRGQAMERVESLHRAATPEERDASATPLLELFSTDASLREACSGILEHLKAEFRVNLTSAPLSQKSGYNAQPQLACVDRKA